MAEHSRKTKTTGGTMIVTKKELFKTQAPCWNFELNADQLLTKALETGYVTKVKGQPDSYLVNNNYGKKAE